MLGFNDESAGQSQPVRGGLNLGVLRVPIDRSGVSETSASTAEASGPACARPFDSQLSRESRTRWKPVPNSHTVEPAWTNTQHTFSYPSVNPSRPSTSPQIWCLPAQRPPPPTRPTANARSHRISQPNEPTRPPFPAPTLDHLSSHGQELQRWIGVPDVGHRAIEDGRN